MTASPRAARISRALAISSAAVVVSVAATACESAAADSGSGYGAGQSHQPGAAGHSHGPVVPVSTSTQDDVPEPAEPGDAADPARPAEPAEPDEPVEEKDDEGDEEKAGKQDGDDKEAPPELDIIGTDCDDSDLDRHDGFEKAPRCVQTSFGEVSAGDQNPSLLITDAPRSIKAGEDFALVVSTRNLKRDRFLGAAVGGYYAEASFLDGEGIQRGHFHTACRMLESLDEAPDATPDPAFFLATQDNEGGAGEDKVTVDVTGLADRGTAQCAVWAGDGSHRVPMMERANQTPAFDVVRITVE